MSKGFDACVFDLLKKNFKNADEQAINDALVRSAGKNALNIVTFFMNSDVTKKKITAKGVYQALLQASEHKHYEITQFLRTHKVAKTLIASAKPDIFDVGNKMKGFENALFKATGKGYLDVVKLFSEYKGIPGWMIDRAFCNAARYGHLEIVKFLATHAKLTSTGVNKGLNWTIISPHVYHKDVFDFILKHEKLTIEGINLALVSAKDWNYQNIVVLLEKFRRDNFNN